jgi:hypothetical protein
MSGADRADTRVFWWPLCRPLAAQVAALSAALAAVPAGHVPPGSDPLFALRAAAGGRYRGRHDRNPWRAADVTVIGIEP